MTDKAKASDKVEAKAETLFAVEAIKVGGVRVQAGDLASVPAADVEGLLARGLVSRSEPTAHNAFPMPNGPVALVELLAGLKHAGKFQRAGDIVEIPTDLYQRIGPDFARLVG